MSISTISSIEGLAIDFYSFPMPTMMFTVAMPSLSWLRLQLFRLVSEKRSPTRSNHPARQDVHCMAQDSWDPGANQESKIHYSFRNREKSLKIPVQCSPSPQILQPNSHLHVGRQRQLRCFDFRCPRHELRHRGCQSLSKDDGLFLRRSIGG